VRRCSAFEPATAINMRVTLSWDHAAGSAGANVTVIRRPELKERDADVRSTRITEETLANQQRGRGIRAAHCSIVAALVIAAGCSPLPGASLDPVYLKAGTQVTQAPSSASTTASPRRQGDAAAATVWVGRYQDSRGSGDVTFSIVRGATTVSGTWKARTGGGGPITALADGSGHRLQLRMENTATECPATFEGWAEITESTFTANYRGKDCEGPVSDGRLELRLR